MELSERRTGVLLDRDGVLAENVFWDGRWRAPRNMREFRPIAGAAAAVTCLRAADLAVAVVTNQPDVGAGITPMREVDAMHACLRAEMGISSVYVCAHTQSDACDCRKPKPGLLQRAAADLGFDLASSYMVGDRWRDISAGHICGCRTVLIGDGGGEKFPVLPDVRVKDLGEAAELILDEINSDRRSTS
ncbi:MAG: HAD-IIIA family hydrolase [Telmatospirillum sp.]|nr:HAD-IIIA family hydrolase [Telmatospirillum sp.]